LEEAIGTRDVDSSGLRSWRALAGQVIGSSFYHDADQLLRAYTRKPAEMVALLLHKRSFARSSLFIILSVMLVAITLLYGWVMLRPKPAQMLQPTVMTKPVQGIAAHTMNELPRELQYTEINEDLLIKYLNSKSSLLADQPYLQAILKVAKEKDIHPLFLFAITGQEQAFVPRTNKLAKKIANNPFNVYYSWKEYNTTIEQSAQIAANTINRLSKDRPYNRDAITWINREYAEDLNWSYGVTSILQAMKRYIQSDIER
jgi:hypothetical protein